MANANSGGVYSVLDDPRINARADFFAGLGQGIDGSWANTIGTVIPSTTEVERYNWIGTVPQLAEWKGEALLQQLPNYAATLTNQAYQTGLLVDKNDLRRDKTGQIRARIAGLGRRVASHWESLVSTLILNSETASGTDLSGKAYDGQAFFDTDHSYTGSNYTTNQSNDLSSGVFNISTATAPTPDEAAKIIHEMIGTFYSLKDDQGEPINGDAKSFLFMVGTTSLWTGLSAAASLQNLTSGASNVVQGLKAQGINVTVALNPRLSAKTDKVYAFRTDGPLGAFILQDEVPVAVEEEDPGITKKHVIVSASAVRAAGYGIWQSAVLATLS